MRPLDPWASTGFEKVKEFIREASMLLPEAVASAVEGPALDSAKFRELAEKLGAEVRLRPRLESEEPRDGAACGRGHFLLEGRGMTPRREHHLTGAERHLCGQLRRNSSRQAAHHAAFGDRFQQHVNKRWSARGYGRHRVEMALVQDHAAAERAEERTCDVEMRLGGKRAAG